MARLRLLVGLAIVLPGASLGCLFFPPSAPSRHIPDIRGTVIDKRNGAPVTGAVVYATFDSVPAMPNTVVETVWATTDEQGQFLIPAHTTPPGALECPGYIVVHRDYGIGGAPRLADPHESNPPPLCYNPVLEIKPSPVTIHTLQDPKEWKWLCSLLTSAACDNACETFYGNKCRR